MRLWLPGWSYAWCRTVTPPVLPWNSHRRQYPTGGDSCTSAYEARDLAGGDKSRPRLVPVGGQRRRRYKHE